MTQLRVLICGGGIAGNALAFWLSKLGHNITVVERFSSLRTTGLQIDLRGHGIEVLKRMDLEQAFRSKSVPEQGWQIVDGSGKRRAYFPANKTGKGLQEFTSEFEIMRGDLVALLYEASQGQTRYLFGTSIESCEEDKTGVTIRFANGQMDRFDLVVGADGQWSRTRRLMLGKDTPDAMCPISGLYTGYFTMPKPIEESEEYLATVYMVPGSRGIMVRRHNPETIQVYIGGRSDVGGLSAVRRGNVKAEKEALVDMFQGAKWQTERILQGLQDSTDFYCERLGLVKLDAWHKGRIVLVGDAAYCPSANTGMGTTSSIVGAYILAGEISRHYPVEQDNVSTARGLHTALEAYEKKFRPFMDQVQKGVLEDRGFFPSSALGIAMVHFLAGIASFLKLNIAGWALKEKVKDWDLPEYEEMARKVHL